MPERLKDLFFTDESLQKFADVVKLHHRGFDRKHFLSLIRREGWEQMELKQKMRHTTLCLAEVLPGDFPSALDILTRCAPDVKGFEAMVLPDYVQLFGMQHWDLSLEALEHFTRFSSSEMAIRPFLRKDPARALERMLEWAEDSNEHVRRLASEGCRPRLPWAEALPQFKKDPRPLFPILQKLKGDTSEYVRKSVANNLNDISKDNPELVLDVCESWWGQSPGTDWIIKHACRTLLKGGDKRALKIFGFADPSRLLVKDFSFDPKVVRIGQEIHFSFVVVVQGEKPARIRTEYRIDFARARGKSSPKIFQISERVGEPGQYAVSRRHSLADQSTRRHYPGRHSLTVIINGEAKVSVNFQVEKQ